MALTARSRKYHADVLSYRSPGLIGPVHRAGKAIDS